MWKVCVFDLDGTLADTLESLHYCTNAALEFCGLNGRPKEEYKNMVGDGAVMQIKRALTAAGDPKLQHLDQALDKYREIFAKHCMYQVKPYDGIPELLSWLKEKKIHIAVLSNKPHAQTVDVVESLFGKNYFDRIQGQVEGLKKKPSPDGALLLAKEFGAEPEECLYLGDTNTDMQTGNAAGMYTIGVTWGFRSRKELVENKADALIDHPMELCRLFSEEEQQ